MVLNRKLRFMFDPVSFPGQYSDLRPEVVLDAAKKPMLAALYRPPDNQGGTSKLLAFDIHGKIIKTLPFREIQRISVPGRQTGRKLDIVMPRSAGIRPL